MSQSCFLSPIQSLNHSSKIGNFSLLNKAVDRHRLSQEPEGKSKSNGLTEPWVCLHPSHAAQVMGIAHSPPVGLQLGIPLKNLWVVQWV